MTKRVPLDDLLVGLAVLLLAGLIAYETTQIAQASLYAKVGPTAIPWIVVGMMTLLGLALTVQALRGGWAKDEVHGELDLPGMFWIAAGLVANLVLIDTAGFIIASTALFTATARAFQSRNPLRDAGIGFLLAFVAYIGFDRVLGYKIGTGLIENLF